MSDNGCPAFFLAPLSQALHRTRAWNLSRRCDRRNWPRCGCGDRIGPDGAESRTLETMMRDFIGGRLHAGLRHGRGRLSPIEPLVTGLAIYEVGLDPSKDGRVAAITGTMTAQLERDCDTYGHRGRARRRHGRRRRREPAAPGRVEPFGERPEPHLRPHHDSWPTWRSTRPRAPRRATDERHLGRDRGAGRSGPSRSRATRSFRWR